MKIKNILSEGSHRAEATMLSTAEQDARINKMWRSATRSDGFRLLYLWAKQNKITFEEFKELAHEFTRE